MLKKCTKSAVKLKESVWIKLLLENKSKNKAKKIVKNNPLTKMHSTMQWQLQKVHNGNSVKALPVK